MMFAEVSSSSSSSSSSEISEYLSGLTAVGSDCVVPIVWIDCNVTGTVDDDESRIADELDKSDTVDAADELDDRYSLSSLQPLTD